ncbi:MAG TPA: beta-ketoacyl-[acyl-carrier-protein] synthase family protein [Puia sp.]|nr:beta-ketoacyl-[acyl-carrier-protein] synthase family protein [Puia sp.]
MNRVVITGLGVVSPNGINIPSFTCAIRNGISGIHFRQELKDYAMGCCVAGVPLEFDEHVLSKYLSPGVYKSLRSSTVKYALTAALEAWQNAGLIMNNADVQPETGCIFGNGVCDVEHMRYAIQMFENLEVQKLGVRHIEQLMTSAASAFIGGLFGLGNQVMANSSACSTGTEAIILAYERIKSGHAKRMIAGSCEANSKYIWGVFDAMRVLNRNHNHDPAAASRPMSVDSAGFIPGCGAGALILEELETAVKRNATVYAEIKAGFVNSGGQRNGGTMTAPSPYAVKKCIETAIKNSGIHPCEIDLVCGHLTGTTADKIEIANWAEALGRKGKSFPFINSLKSLTGHCISATGSIESVAAILQMQHSFIQPNRNCENIQPEILGLISENAIVREPMEREINTVIKANFGFGDVNSCIIFKKFHQ